MVQLKEPVLEEAQECTQPVLPLLEALVIPADATAVVEWQYPRQSVGPKSLELILEAGRHVRFLENVPIATLNHTGGLLLQADGWIGISAALSSAQQVFY
jgi:hypothetical protein